MNLEQMVALVQNKRFTKINNFGIDIGFADGDATKFSKICGWADNMNDELNTSLISVSTTQYQNALVNQYVSYEWRFHQGRDELYRFDMTFRDYDQMYLYNLFRKTYLKGKEQYFDNIKMNIKITLEEDYGVDAIPIFQTSTAIIENLSRLQFSHNTENQIAEFTVSFICNTRENTL